MTNLTRIYFYSALILCLWPFKQFVGGKDLSYPVEKRTNGVNPGVNNAKTLFSSEIERTINSEQRELFSFSDTNPDEPSQKKTQSDTESLDVRSVGRRGKFNSEEMNSSVDIECLQTEEAGIVNNERKLQREATAMNSNGPHFKDHENYRSNRRQKRDSQPTGPTSATSEGSPAGSPEGSSSEPLTTTEPITDPENAWPEPEPDWSQAIAQWKEAWPLHTYGFAVVFTLIALVPPLELVRMQADKIRVSALKSTVLVIIFLFSSSRAFALFLDPYGSTKRFHLIVTQLLFSLGHPCIISALSLLLLVLIDTTKMNIAPPRFQRVQVIIPVVISHVALVIITDFVVAYFLEAKVLLLICQTYFLLLGSLMAIGYSCVGWKIRKNIKANVNSKTSVDTKMRRLQYLIAACAVASASVCVLTVYSAAGVLGIYSDVEYVEAWPWWTFQTLNRLLEVAICIVVLLMNTKSTKRKILPAFTTASVFNSRRNTLKVKQIIPSEKLSSVG